jgi:transcriptional regulator with XRE-family HTH domain
VVSVEQACGADQPEQHFFDIKKMVAQAKKLDISQRALAKQLGVDKGTVIRWRQGFAEPSPRLLIDIAAALELAPDELYKPGAQGRDLAYYRVIAGYSANALSPRLRVSNAFLRSVERGERAPSRSMYDTLRDLLGIDDPTLTEALSRCRPRPPRPRRQRVDLAPARLESGPDVAAADQLDLPSRVFFRPLAPNPAVTTAAHH